MKRRSVYICEGLSGPPKTTEATNTQAWRSGERWSQYKSASQQKQMAYKSNDIAKELSEHRENKKLNPNILLVAMKKSKGKKHVGDKWEAQAYKRVMSWKPLKV